MAHTLKQSSHNSPNTDFHNINQPARMMVEEPELKSEPSSAQSGSGSGDFQLIAIPEAPVCTTAKDSEKKTANEQQQSGEKWRS
jgi:hypothetical protein